ncbi:MAG: hypothetical protein PUA59_01360 [Clostridium sp.]|nr:hypothetical protein [Clostridium sp.]
MKDKKKIKQILAWIALVVIAGMVIATLVLGILGSPYTLSMLGATMGVSITIWVLFWISGMVNGNKEDQ